MQNLRLWLYVIVAAIASPLSGNTSGTVTGHQTSHISIQDTTGMAYVADTITSHVTERIATPETQEKRRNIITRFIDAFNATDTTYITPNRYNWAFMLQNTNSFENYKLTSHERDQQLVFSPKPSFRFGPYLGWRWIFLGYTFEANSFQNGFKSETTEFELSLYSAMLGCDLIYRRTGNNFRLRKVKGFGESAESVEGTDCNGINVKVTGINAYYIFNHKRFSYPAAFAQSTVQRKSCGTWKVGISCTQHELDFDYHALPEALTHNSAHQFSREFMFDKLKYTDISLSVGYAYNWVFKRNFLLCASISPAIGYKITHISPIPENEIPETSVEQEENPLFPLHIDDFNFDVIGRLGLVWNNTKYFAGMSLIIHNYNYRHQKLSINNTFGTLNFYVGFNFHKRKQYRN